MSWIAYLWTAVIPSVPVVWLEADVWGYVLGLLTLMAAVGIWFEREKSARDKAAGVPAGAEKEVAEGPLGCAA
jgi:hypothetical protein